MTVGPVVSVVIPVYNREGLIRRSLDSVLDQTHRPLEILVVDDGSSDATVSRVEAWREEHADAGLTLSLINQRHRGANAARNAGIEAANGDFVAFLDSDDVWLPNKISRQLAVFGADLAIGGVYCELAQVDLVSGHREQPGPGRLPAGNILRQMLIHDVTAPTSCWMVRRECFRKTGPFDVSLPARQDWDMWIRLAAGYSIGCVDEVLVEMGNHPGERVRSRGEREIEAHKIIFAKYADLRREEPRWVSLAARSAMYRRRGRVYFHRGISVPKAIGMQVLAIMVWPFAFDSYAALAGTLLPGGLREKLRRAWNRVFGRTPLAIKTH